MSSVSFQSESDIIPTSKTNMTSGVSSQTSMNKTSVSSSSLQTNRQSMKKNKTLSYSIIQKQNIKNNQQFLIEIQDIPLSYINGLRRTILRDIDVFGMLEKDDDIIIKKNNTLMNNEILKHRLSCVPVHIPDISIDLSSYRIVLHVKNDANTHMDVTSEHLQIMNITSRKMIEQEKRDMYFPKNMKTDDYILLHVMRPFLNSMHEPDEIYMEAPFRVCNAGISSTHNVVSTCTYKFTEDTEKQKDAWKTYLQSMKNQWTDEQIEYEKRDWFVHQGKRYYFKDRYQFIIETIGVYSNEEIFYKGCMKLNEKLQHIVDLIESKTLSLHRGNTVHDSWDIIIPNDNYTIGKIIEETMYLLFHKSSSVLSFVGYKKNHPHENDSILRVVFNDSKNEEDRIYTLMLESIQHAKTIFDNLASEV